MKKIYILVLIISLCSHICLRHIFINKYAKFSLLSCYNGTFIVKIRRMSYKLQQAHRVKKKEKILQLQPNRLFNQCVGVGVSKIPTCHCSVSGSESWLSRPPPPAASWRPAGPSAPGGSYGRWKPSDFQLQTKKKKRQALVWRELHTHKVKTCFFMLSYPMSLWVVKTVYTRQDKRLGQLTRLGLVMKKSTTRFIEKWRFAAEASVQGYTMAHCGHTRW